MLSMVDLLCIFSVFFTVHVNGESILDEEDKMILLQAHNYYRSLVAMDAADMQKMVRA